MGVILQTEGANDSTAGVPEASHYLQAKAFLRRWRGRLKRAEAGRTFETVPDRIEPPAEAVRHERQFSWVVYEQRLVMFVLGFLLAACGLVWTLALHLERKPPVVIRAPESLKAVAAAFYGTPELSYDQLAFFLHGCLPLLYAVGDGGHPLLPLAQGLVAPEVYDEADRRLIAAEREVAANQMTQTLTITGVSGVVADAKSGRAAAYVHGYLAVTVRQNSATVFPWRAQVVLQANPISRLNPYPFYVTHLEARAGPRALAWDQDHGSGLER